MQASKAARAAMDFSERSILFKPVGAVRWIMGGVTGSSRLRKRCARAPAVIPVQAGITVVRLERLILLGRSRIGLTPSGMRVRDVESHPHLGLRLALPSARRMATLLGGLLLRLLLHLAGQALLQQGSTAASSGLRDGRSSRSSVSISSLISRSRLAVDVAGEDLRMDIALAADASACCRAVPRPARSPRGCSSWPWPRCRTPRTP